jgi:hypothetical protein
LSKVRAESKPSRTSYSWYHVSVLKWAFHFPFHVLSHVISGPREGP